MIEKDENNYSMIVWRGGTKYIYVTNDSKKCLLIFLRLSRLPAAKLTHHDTNL